MSKEKSNAGRRKAFANAEEMQSRIDGYFEDRKASGDVPTIESLAVWLGLDRRTLLNYEKEESHEEFNKIVKIAKTKILAEFIDYALAAGNKAPAALMIFMLKNNWGYTDRQEVTITDSFEVEF